jgi:hypothetical protein
LSDSLPVRGECLRPVTHSLARLQGWNHLGHQRGSVVQPGGAQIGRVCGLLFRRLHRRHAAIDLLDQSRQVLQALWGALLRRLRQRNDGKPDRIELRPEQLRFVRACM